MSLVLKRRRTKITMNLTARFEAKYIPEPNTGCWLWTVGTAADNSLDRDTKGRHGRAKLSANDIPSIRQDSRSIVDIAMHYGVSPRNIEYIKSGKRWKHA